jgi:hypothetical protein
MRKHAKKSPTTCQVTTTIPTELRDVLVWLAYDRQQRVTDLLREAIILLLQETDEYDFYAWQGMVPTAHGEAVNWERPRQVTPPEKDA